MDLKEMRRTCAALVEDLALSVPAAPEQLIDSLCAAMGQRLGKPVRHRLVQFPAGTVTGLWMATGDVHYVLCEERTSPWHQMLITGHEYWHMHCNHATPIDEGDAARLLFSALEPHTVARILAARDYCAGPHEQEAELFATLLLDQVSRWLPTPTWTVPAHAAGIVDRLETSLGCQSSKRSHG
jgi:hypothetical protein